MNSTRRLFLGALILLLAAGTARAQKKSAGKVKLKLPEGIHWHHDIKTAFKEAVDRNAPILVGFIMDGAKLCDMTVAGMYKNKATIAFTRKFVCLVAARGKHEAVAGRGLDGRKKSVCSKFGCVSCPEHQRVEVWAFAHFNEAGSIMTPQHVFLDPRGKVIQRLKHVLATTNEELHAVMRRAIELVGPGIDSISFHRLTEELKRIRGHVIQKKYRKALDSLLEVSRVAGRSTVGERARAMLKDLEGVALLELKEVDKLIAAGEFKAARDRATLAKRNFRGLNTGRIFNDRLNLLGGSKGSAASKANRLLIMAEDSFKAGRYALAEETFRRIVDRHGATRAAGAARKRLRAFKTDEKLKAALARCKVDRECLKWMKLADALMKSGRKGKAKDYYTKILTIHPDSPYAAEARKKLQSR